MIKKFTLVFSEKCNFFQREKGKYTFTCSRCFVSTFLLHYIFFAIFPVLVTFWNTKAPIFFSIFQQLPIFVEPYHRTYVHQCRALIIQLKHAISPYSGIVWVLFYNILRFSMKISAKSQNLGWKQWKFNEIGDVFDPGIMKQMLAMCACHV